MNIECPKCGSPHTKKRGWNISRSGAKQRYNCRDCGADFSENDVGEEAFPAVLLMDIETLPIKAYTWETYNVNINKEQIIADFCILCWSAKWLLDDRMITACLTPKETKTRNDKRICQTMWQLMDEADVIIGQNSRRFDVLKLNTRFWQHKMSPPSSYKIIDTLESARKVFSMTFNGLDYLGEYLGIGGKLKTDFMLWRDCDRGDKDALERMQSYNERDVTLLESVYLKMRSWIPGHPKFSVYNKIVGVCPVCMSPDIKDIGLYTATVKQYKEWRCNMCGCVYHSTKPEK